MKLYEVILIGIALSMDACALTIANCTTYRGCLNKKKEWAMPIFFAIFQGVMPLIGYFIGSLFAGYIGTVSNFVTAIIFSLLALKIIIDIIKEKKEEESLVEVSATCKRTTLTFSVLLLQALATSIDALAIGITLIDLTFSIFIAIGIISLVTFALVVIALFFGKYLGKLFGEYAEWCGAAILFFLSIKSLIEALI